jgi:hypothetical protein
VEKVRNTYKILLGNTEGKRPPIRSKCRRKDNSKRYPREVECEGAYRIKVAQETGAMAEMKLRVL